MIRRWHAVALWGFGSICAFIGWTDGIAWFEYATAAVNLISLIAALVSAQRGGWNAPL